MSIRIDRLAAGAAGIALVLVGCATSPLGRPRRASEDLLLLHGRVLAPGRAPASALWVHAGRIAALGSDEEVRRRAPAGASIRDLRGAVVLPGLRDAHVHLVGLGRRLLGLDLDLSATRSVQEIKSALRSAIRDRRLPPGAWLTGSGWAEGRFTDGAESLPESTAPLDEAAPENPVVLWRKDGHTAWVNRRALERAGITRATPDPPGGAIRRDASGEPTGLLVDHAKRLVGRLLPEPTPEEMEAVLSAAALACARAGLVEVHDARVGIAEERALRRLAEAGRLPLRVYAMLDQARPDLERRLREPPTIALGGRLTIRAVKAFADGAAPSHGALLLAPYADDPSSRGIATTSLGALEALARRCAEQGYQLAVHAVGDAANREVLDVYARALRDHPGARWRIEHAFLLDPAEVTRFAELGVIASMQPSSVGPAAIRLFGPERARRFALWRELLASGAHLAFGSDVPAILSERPLVGIFLAVTRTDLTGRWVDTRTDERLTGAEALALYTEGPAYAAFEERERGRLEVGMDADLTLLSDDPLDAAAHEPARLLKMKVLGTYVTGRAVGQ